MVRTEFLVHDWNDRIVYAVPQSDLAAYGSRVARPQLRPAKFYWYRDSRRADLFETIDKVDQAKRRAQLKAHEQTVDLINLGLLDNSLTVEH
jgi:hypothetical protein